MSLRLSGVSACLWCLCASLVSLRLSGVSGREGPRGQGARAIGASASLRGVRRPARAHERVARGARRLARIGAIGGARRAPARFTPANLVGIYRPRALNGFAGYYRPGCSCTPEAPRSFCETRAPRVFTDPALSPPEQLLWLTFFSGARRESSQKVVPGACSRIVCVDPRTKQTVANNKDGSILRNSA